MSVGRPAPVRCRQFAAIEPLPNEGSSHQTPASLYYDTFYSNLLLLDRWTWDRFVRLCRFVKHTPYEMGSLIMLRHVAVDNFKQRNRIPGNNARAIALILTMLEAQILKEWSSDLITNPFPTMRQQPSAETSSKAG